MSTEPTPHRCATTYGQLFPQVYLAFHRRNRLSEELTQASKAVLLHLVQTGPVTVTELARHLGRAQSVVSEIVDQLEKNDLASRMPDDRDRRKSLIWLTEKAQRHLESDAEVLSRELLEAAFEHMTEQDRQRLLEGTAALLDAARLAAKHRRDTEDESHGQSSL